MNRRPLVRSLLAFAVIAAAISLAGCDTDSLLGPQSRSMQPLSEKMLADIETKNMAKESPILVRIFKEESELEVWKEDRTGHYALLKTYPICRWSGELGPKIKEGDRQAPEGFYSITPALMNPNSSYYLAINMGFPNAYDRSNGRTGAFLMIHGDCSSRGCYAMTDEQIAEIYALARESFFGGQQAFQIQAYPFKMTPLNMARHRNSPHMSYWKMLKEGYDHFVVTQTEPKVDVCEKRYVFDAQAKGKFASAAKCPVYQVPEEIANAVKDKQRADDVQTAEYVRRGTPAAPIRTGTDGGMNPVFLAALEPSYVDGGGFLHSRPAPLPGTIPPNVRPPGPPQPEGATGSVPAPATPARAPVEASSGSGGGGNLFSGLFSSSGSSAPQSGGVLDRMSRFVGLRGSDPPAAEPPAKSKPAPKPSQTAAVRPKPSAGPDPRAPSAKPVTNPGAIRPQERPPAQEANAEQQRAPANNAGTINGAAPTVPSGVFDGRFGAWR